MGKRVTLKQKRRRKLLSKKGRTKEQFGDKKICNKKEDKRSTCNEKKEKGILLNRKRANTTIKNETNDIDFESPIFVTHFIFKRYQILKVSISFIYISFLKNNFSSLQTKTNKNATTLFVPLHSI